MTGNPLIGVFSRRGLEAVVAPWPPAVIRASAGMRPLLEGVLAHLDRASLPHAHGEVRPGIAGRYHVRLQTEVTPDDPRWPAALAAWLDRRTELRSCAVALIRDEAEVSEVLP